VGLIITLAAIVPLSWWLRRNPHETPKIWILMGFLPFVLVPLHLYVAVISWPEWQGFIQGAEFSVLDALALALYLSLPGGPRPLPFRLSMALYFFAVLLATLQARAPLAAIFYPCQLARMFLVYAAVTRGVGADPRVAPALMKGMAAGLVMEAGIAIWQRFGLGVLQVDGTFPAQNQLGLVSHFVVFPFFALLLTGPRGWLPPAVVLAGMVIEALTTSRAALGIGGLGFATVFLLSAARLWTSRKILVLMLGGAMIAILVPPVLSSFEQRESVNSTAGSDYERDALLRAAAMIFSEYPLGIGPNHFLITANIEGYNQKAGVPPNSRTSIVHNVYWLGAVETGYLGLVTFVLLLLQPLRIAFLCSWRYRGDKRGDFCLGLGVALLTVYIHCFFEWVFVDFQTQYMFALNVGLVAGLAQQLGYWRHYPKHARLGAPTVPIRATNDKFLASSSVAQSRFIVRPSGDRPMSPEKR
jgi:O-Antigen ligase